MEKSSFFNSVNGDRKYDTKDWANYFNKFITNGVFPSPSSNLQVVTGDGMNVIVKAGPAWINGYCYENTSDLTLAIEAADGVLNRIDRVVIRLDTIGRQITAAVKKGTFASSPVAPTLQRDADAYELGIADISIAKGTVSISQVNISDLRLNNSLCGVVNSLIQVDTESLFIEYEAGMKQKTDDFTADFLTWFQTIQNTLSDDVTGNLLNLINTHKNDKNNPHGVTAEQVGAETPTGAQSKADAAQTAAIDALNTHKNESAILTPQSGSTANAIVLNWTAEQNKKGSFMATADNTGNITINGKPFLKQGGTQIPASGVKNGKVYDYYYDTSSGGRFFLLARATGTVTPDKVLAGETFSTENGSDQVGTRDESQLLPANIKKGVTIADVTGTAATAGNITLNDLKIPTTVETQIGFVGSAGKTGVCIGNKYAVYSNGSWYALYDISEGLPVLKETIPKPTAGSDAEFVMTDTVLAMITYDTPNFLYFYSIPSLTEITHYTSTTGTYFTQIETDGTNFYTALQSSYITIKKYNPSGIELWSCVIPSSTASFGNYAYNYIIAPKKSDYQYLFAAKPAASNSWYVVKIDRASGNIVTTSAKTAMNAILSFQNAFVDDDSLYYDCSVNGYWEKMKMSDLSIVWSKPFNTYASSSYAIPSIGDTLSIIKDNYIWLYSKLTGSQVGGIQNIASTHQSGMKFNNDNTKYIRTTINNYINVYLGYIKI